MDVPVGPQVAQEAGLGFDGMTPPDVLGMRPQRIDGGAPPDFAGAFTHLANQRRAALVGVGYRRHHGPARRMAEGLQAPARKNRHLAREARTVEREHHVRCRQSAADDENMVQPGQPLHCLRVPRIGAVEPVRQRLQHGMRHRREIAERQRHRAALQNLTVSQLQPRRILRKVYRNRLAVDDLRAGARLAERLDQHVAKIHAVSQAGHEAIGLVRRGKVHPAQEMPRVVREGAHVGGAHVEQVLGPPGAEGHTFGELRRTLLDQCHLHAVAQQVDGQERPAETPADDRNRQV
jgi:hypothetical protein